MSFSASPSPEYQYNWSYLSTVSSADRVDYTNNTNPAPGGSVQEIFSPWCSPVVTKVWKLHRRESIRKPIFIDWHEPGCSNRCRPYRSLSMVRFCQLLPTSVNLSLALLISGQGFVNKWMNTPNHKTSWLNRFAAYRLLIQFQPQVWIFFECRHQLEINPSLHLVLEYGCLTNRLSPVLATYPHK